MSSLVPLPATEHLAKHRRLIVRWSLIAGAVGLVPLPIIDELVTGLARGRLLRRLADLRQVDLTRSAVLVLCEEPQSTMLRNATLAAFTLLLARYWRRMFPVVAVGRRVDEIVHTFQLATLFDHYCARHHVGAALKGAEAARVRGAIEAVQAGLHRDLAARVFARALGRAAASVRGLPRRLAGPWRGRAPRPLTGDEALDEVAAGLDQAGLLRRAVRIVDEELGAAGHGYLAELVRRFDESYGQAGSQPASGTPPAPAGG
jgi:hypothetical protein